MGIRKNLEKKDYRGDEVTLKLWHLYDTYVTPRISRRLGTINSGDNPYTPDLISP